MYHFSSIRLPTECVTYPQRYFGRSILLVHSEAHPVDVQKLKYCKMRAVFLSRNMTVQIQPLDQGIVYESAEHMFWLATCVHYEI